MFAKRNKIFLLVLIPVLFFLIGCPESDQKYATIVIQNNFGSTVTVFFGVYDESNPSAIASTGQITNGSSTIFDRCPSNQDLNIWFETTSSLIYVLIDSPDNPKVFNLAANSQYSLTITDTSYNFY